MLRRVALGVIFLLSLGWIAYYAYDLLTTGNDYSPAYLFNKEDEGILIVNRPSEVDFRSIEQFAASPTIDLAEKLNDSLYTKGYFSAKRGQILLERESAWNEANINALFGDLAINYSESGTFDLNGYKGRHRKTSLYLYDKEYEMNEEALPAFVHDSKASASFLKVNSSNVIREVIDVYFKENDKVNFVTRNEAIEAGRQVKDHQIFGPIVSSKCSNYHFRERDYWVTKDSIFASSPMAAWTSSGFVQIEYKGVPAIISDYINGQDPILVLNEHFQTLEASSFKIPLCKDFPADRKFHIKYLEDFVVISPSEDVCDQLIADHKLGNTMALDGNKKKQAWDDLPAAVSERYIGSEKRLSRAVYNGYVLETHFGAFEAAPTENSQTIAMACNFDVYDFITLPGRGNAIAVSSKGDIARFSSGSIKWKKSIGQNVLGDIQLIDLFGNEEQHLLISTEDEVHVISLEGNYASGFPIKLEKSTSVETKFYRWKSKSYLLVACENEVYQFDGKGRELNILKAKVSPQRKIDIWVSQNKLFAGFARGSTYEMYNMEAKRSHREIEIPFDYVAANVPNQIYHFGLKDGTFQRIDQKGVIMNFEKYQRSKIHPIKNAGKNPITVLQSINEIHLINQQGIPFGSIHLPFNEIEAVSYNQLNSGKTIVGIIDGLENNVYLYKVDGTSLTNKPLEGRGKVTVNSEDSKLRVTTIVGQFLTEYIVN